MHKSMHASLPLLLALSMLAPAAASAKSVKDYEAMPAHDQSEYVVSYLEKMTYEIGKTNPALAKQIKDYFVVTPTGKEFPDGIDKFEVELSALDALAKKGKADLSSVQVESILVWVVKQKFPPEKNQPPQK
jgi:soluble cytochrome b562